MVAREAGPIITPIALILGSSVGGFVGAAALRPKR